MDIEVDFTLGEDGAAVPATVRFGRRCLRVLSVMDRWYGRQETWWKLDTEGGPFILRQVDSTGEWALAAVPNSGTIPRPAVTAPPRGERPH